MEKCRKLHPDNVRSDAKGNSFLVSVANEHETIEEINLIGCDDVTDAGLCVLMERCLCLHPDNVQSTVKGDAFLAGWSVLSLVCALIDLCAHWYVL